MISRVAPDTAARHSPPAWIVPRASSSVLSAIVGTAFRSWCPPCVTLPWHMGPGAPAPKGRKHARFPAGSARCHGRRELTGRKRPRCERAVTARDPPGRGFRSAAAGAAGGGGRAEAAQRRPQQFAPGLPALRVRRVGGDGVQLAVGGLEAFVD